MRVFEKCLWIKSEDARFEALSVGRFLRKDDGVFRDSVSDRFVSAIDNCLDGIAQPHVLQRWIDAHCDSVHVQRLRRRRGKHLTGVRIDHGPLRRSNHIRMKEKIYPCSVRVPIARFLRKPLNGLQQPHVVEPELRQYDPIQLGLNCLAAGAGKS